MIQQFKVPTSRTVSLPAPLGMTAVQVVAETPYRRLKATWAPYANAQAYGLRFFAPHSGVLWRIGLSAGWLNSSTTYTMPDLRGVPGWINAWGLPSNTRQPTSASGAGKARESLLHRRLRIGGFAKELLRNQRTE